MARSVSCPSCGKEVAKGDRFCAGCGTEVVDPVDTATGQGTHDLGTNPTQCVKCGASMASDDRFCPKCGTSRPEEATVVSHVSLRNAQAAHLIEATQGEFEIIRELGSGAMGAVYLARDVALDRMVAIKVIAPHLLSDETMLSRFRLEAQTVASLRHPNIVAVHAVKQSDDLHFFVMEFIDGPPLRTIVKAHAPLDYQIVQGLLYQVGSALNYAHRKGGGVIHRDIKPANIMLDREGGAFVTDFGISKIAEVKTGLTQTGATIGTPEYMSPEQCRGETLTGASDQYALGIVAYEMLCGRTPFSGSQYYIMVAHTNEAPKPIRELRPDVPADVALAVERMLAKTPQERWPDLDQAVRALGGGPLGFEDPTRTKIVALTGSTLTVVPAVPGASVSGGGPVTADTATKVSVTGLPSVIEAGDRFTLEADIEGTGGISLSGLGVSWASTDPSIARVEGGVVEALLPGSVSITATAGNVANSVLLTVAEPVPAAVHVSPGAVSIQRGGRIALSAEVRDRRGRPLGGEVSWVSSDAAVATVTDAGVVVATGSGPVTISAECGGATGTAEVVVEAPVGAAPVAADEKPPTPKPAPPKPRYDTESPRPAYRRPGVVAASIVALLAVGYGVLTVVGGGGEASSPAPVSEPPSIGPAGGIDPGAVAGGASGPAAGGAPGTTLPAPGPSEPVDQPEPGTTVAQAEPDPVNAAPADPEPADPGPAVQDDPPNVLAGGARGGGPAAGAGAQPPPAPPPTPGSLAIALATSSMDVGGSQAAGAQVTSTAGVRMTPGEYSLSWRSSNPGVLSVEANGAVRARGPGTAWLVAAAGGARDSVPVTVVVTVAAVAIAESDFSIEAGSARDLSAAVVGSDQQTMSRPVVWSSADPDVAVVDGGTGRVAGLAPGTAMIRATADGVTDSVRVTVVAAAPAAPAAPAPPALPSDDAARAAIGTFMTAMGSGDADAVRAFWSAADADGRDDVLDLMGERSFTATLGSVTSPTLEGDAAMVAFDVSASYRTFAGSNRERTVSLRGQLVAAGSAWRLTSLVLR